MKVLRSAGKVLERFFVFLIVGVAAFALLRPEPFIALRGVKLFNQSLIVVGLAVIMFVMGLTTKKENFKVVFTRPKDVLIGVLAQYTVMPLLAFGISKMLNLPPELAVGLVLLGTTPGGTASNVMTYLAKGDVALSVGMTSVTTLLAPVVTPVLTYFLAGNWINVNMTAMFISIVKIVVVPILAGMLMHYFLGEKLDKVKDVLVILPILSIVMIMGMAVAPSREHLLSAGLLLFVAVALHNWLGFGAGYLVAYVVGMDYDRRKALSLEVGLQNSGLAVGLSAQFANPLVALPAVIATMVHQVSGSLLAQVFSRNIHLKLFNRKLLAEVE